MLRETERLETASPKVAASPDRRNRKLNEQTEIDRKPRGNTGQSASRNRKLTAQAWVKIATSDGVENQWTQHDKR
jgi:hypothetical protein